MSGVSSTKAPSHGPRRDYKGGLRANFLGAWYVLSRRAAEPSPNIQRPQPMGCTFLSCHYELLMPQEPTVRVLARKPRLFPLGRPTLTGSRSGFAFVRNLVLRAGGKYTRFLRKRITAGIYRGQLYRSGCSTTSLSARIAIMTTLPLPNYSNRRAMQGTTR